MSSVDHLIERAARALWDEPRWEQASHEQRQYHREAAERALEAVADDLRAEAWDEGHMAGCSDPYARYGECFCGPNPHRIEAGESP